MLYHAYIDDSADGDRKRVVVAGAIIGKKEEWGILNKRWNDRLEADGIQYFKSSQCQALRKQFQKFRDFGMEEGKRRAEKVRDDLDAIILTSRVVGIGVTLSIPFHQRMISDPQTFGHIPSVPYRLAFQQVLAECAKAMLVFGKGNIVTFGHDDGDDFHVLHALYKEFKRLNPKYSRVMYDFVPLDDKLHPAVQAADVAASITCKFALNSMDNPSADNMTRLRQRMYKVVNWLDKPKPHTPDFSTEEAPAKATYAP